jgi:RNA polymerase sigma-70 factor (ECF subfamily)
MKPPQEKQPEADLVSRLKAGDPKAYQELMTTYERRIYSFAFGFLRDPDEAMDIVQDTFLRVFRKIETFKGDSAFTTWLYRIARNLCIDKLRRKKRAPMGEFDDQRRHEVQTHDRPALVGSMDAYAPQESSLRNELGRELMEALDSLGERHREVLLLRELEGFSYAEIAEAMDLPIGTVMSRIYHARQKVQHMLSHYVNDRSKGVRHGT